MRSPTIVSLFIAVAASSVGLTSAPAQAAGCGGYVNVWVSGCAPWDNNPRRMPGAPGYVANQPVRSAPQPGRFAPVAPPLRFSGPARPGTGWTGHMSNGSPGLRR